MADKLEALSMLASKDAAGSNFFEIASRALTLGLGCRWGGFGKLAGSKCDIDIIAFCDAGQLGPCFTYSLDDSPCGQVYQREPEDPFCEFPDDVTSLFSGPEVLKQIGAYSYRGEAMFSPGGTPLAHVFVIHDGPLNWTPEDTAFFRMVAQRAGSEYNRLQAEAELVSARDRALASDRAKTEFLTNTSHELRTPLNSIIGLSELVVDNGTDKFSADQLANFMSEIRKSGTSLLSMINDLLDISRIQLGRIELNEETINLTKCFEDCIGGVQGIALQNDVSVRVAPDSEDISIWADKNAINRILMNLVGNAVKFSGVGDEVTLKAFSTADSIVVEVADQGIGIADADMETVFSHFAQIDSGLNRAAGGTGIGLPLSRELVEKHDGDLKIESAVGVGTTVRIVLPASRQMRGETPAAVA